MVTVWGFWCLLPVVMMCERMWFVLFSCECSTHERRKFHGGHRKFHLRFFRFMIFRICKKKIEKILSVCSFQWRKDVSVLLFHAPICCRYFMHNFCHLIRKRPDTALMIELIMVPTQSAHRWQYHFPPGQTHRQSITIIYSAACRSSGGVFCVTDRARIQPISRRLSRCAQTLTCYQTAIHSPGLPFNGIQPHNPFNLIGYC